MKHIHYPDEPLSRIVKHIWTCEFPGQVGWEHRLPSDAVQILVHVGGRPLRRRDGLAESSVVLAGPTTKAFAIDRADQDALVGITLRPGGLLALGVCPESVVDLALPGFEVLSELGRDSLGMEQVLADLVRQAPPFWLPKAVRLLGTGTGVGTTASQLGQSLRSFRRRFRRQMGLTPKRFARIARMTRSLPLLQDHEVGEVAYITGFADQAHFTADFRELTGTTPGRYAARDGWPLHLADSHKRADGPTL